MKWGGKIEFVSVWGAESVISVSMQAIKVGESSEGGQVRKEATQSVFTRFMYDGMAGGQVPARWIIIGIFKHPS